MKNKKIVLVAGTFDKFHKGHISFLSQAKEKGDVLHVIIARDSSVQRIKGKTPRDTEEVRKHNVELSSIADSVYLGDQTDFLRIPKEINPDVICLGYDQIPPKKLKETFSNIPFHTLSAFHPEVYKSSLMK